MTAANSYQRALITLADMRRNGLVPCVTIVNVDDEYQVPSPDGKPAGTYFTTDRTDAELTAADMWGGPVAIKHRKQR